ncbi:hypothetical protein LshimejAT787_0901610 [Lyophyllum shimeji]|uniref:F-box domain-containing protein n=1 Tax=Lyophyllum shimeji TaxID=47721 RepID=A0A9P3US88_LYOSH|nr:hypothetical protein LshimejAT787_0901610 [Lyophyllum shimeji]
MKGSAAATPDEPADPTGVEATAFSTATVKEAAYAYIREKINLHQASLLYWQQRHNALSIVYRLPPELLASIFKFVAADETDVSKLRWVSVSHVCSRWRRTALDSPDLWSNIPFGNPPWAAEMLARSKKALLTIEVMWGDGPGEVSQKQAPVVQPILAEALTQLSRVKILSLTQGRHWSHENFTDLTTLLDNPGPLLETLKISFLTFGVDGWLPSRVISEAPRLLHLELSRCGIDWQGLSVRNLKSLEIFQPLGPKCPSMIQFLSALSEMPSLESLQFRSPFAPNNSSTLPNNITDLPRLRYLHLDCELENAVLLLERLAYPIHTRLKLIGWARDLDEDPTISLIRRLVEKVKSTVQGPIRSLAVHQHHIKCWQTPGVKPDNPEFPPILEIAVINLSYQSSRLTKELWRPYSLEHLSSLTVIDIDFGPKTWRNLFGKLARLKTLRVGVTDMAFLDALSYGLSTTLPPETSGTPALAGNPRFKALRRLTIMHWDCSDFYDSATSIMEKLTECLAARRGAGLPLHHLEFEKCFNVDEHEVDLLEEVVRTVEWEEYDSECRTDSEVEAWEDGASGSELTDDGDMSD